MFRIDVEKSVSSQHRFEVLCLPSTELYDENGEREKRVYFEEQ